MKSISLTTLLFVAALASGCASIDVNTEGGGDGNAAEHAALMQQLADSSQGK